MKRPSGTKRVIDLAVVSGLYALFIIPTGISSSLSSLALNVAWFLLPAAYLSLRAKKNFSKIFLATLFIGILAFSLDIILLHNNAWTPYRSDFSFRFFGVPPEEMLWFFFHIFYIIVWYEHFLDDERLARTSKWLLRLAIFSIACFALVLAAVYSFPDMIRIRYAYGIFAALAMIPVVIYLCTWRTALLKKLLPLAAFFFFFGFAMEIRAVRLGLWAFPDTENYLGVITLFGATFPVEEIVFWMTLGPIVAIAYYELFADDGH